MNVRKLAPPSQGGVYSSGRCYFLDARPLAADNHPYILEEVPRRFAPRPAQAGTMKRHFAWILGAPVRRYCLSPRPRRRRALPAVLPRQPRLEHLEDRTFPGRHDRYLDSEGTMKAIFNDMQDYSSFLNGATVRNRKELFTVLDSVRDREPFVCEFVGDNGYKLMLGIGKYIGSVQHSPSDGDVPYIVAVEPGHHGEQDYVEFLIGNTPTHIPRRNCLPIEVVKQIAVYFIETGNRWPGVSWKEV
jgi:hypothetical protein